MQDTYTDPAPQITRSRLIGRRLALAGLAPIALVVLVAQEFSEAATFFGRGVRDEFRNYKLVVRTLWNGGDHRDL